MRKASASDWFRLGASIAGYALAALGLALLVNAGGDCGPEVEDCGEGRRIASFVVLALGVAWLAYLVARFLRDPKSF